VINFDMPDTVDAYTHRIGRTGRVHKTGQAFTFVAPGDEPLVREIEEVLGKRIERRRLPGFSYGRSAQESQSPGSHPNHPPRTRSNRKHNRDRSSRERAAAATFGGRI
jgi:ATP-dependent RNA helicase RhlE